MIHPDLNEKIITTEPGRLVVAYTTPQTNTTGNKITINNKNTRQYSKLNVTKIFIGIIIIICIIKLLQTKQNNNKFLIIF